MSITNKKREDGGLDVTSEVHAADNPDNTILSTSRNSLRAVEEPQKRR